jgi:hypothetical protein
MGRQDWEVSTPETLYASTSEGLSIAYQVLGSGRRNFVVVPGIVSHVELRHVWVAPCPHNNSRRTRPPTSSVPEWHPLS